VDPAKKSIYVIFDADSLNRQYELWNNNRATAVHYLSIWVILGLLLMVFLFLLSVGAGRKTRSEGIKRNPVDHVWSEIHLGILVLVLPFLFVILAAYLAEFFSAEYFMRGGLLMWSSGGAAAVLFALWLAVYLSLVRKVKAKTFLKGSLIYMLLHSLFRLFRLLFHKLFSLKPFDGYPMTKRLFIRQLIYIVVSFGILFFMTLVMLDFFRTVWVILIPAALLNVWYILGNRRTLADINTGFDDSFEGRIKAERMRSALVTNVSHDLKTPLTSLISYIDLLSKEEGLSDTARDYVAVLAEKSDRLSHIVSDLFDLSKSSSGDIVLNMEVLDLKKLMEQTLADMKDKVDASGLTMRWKWPEEPVEIRSDGGKLYRIFQNLVDNALKYSLQGTRVYIELVRTDDSACVTIKNTAGYEMDFTSEEILQRFSRGDASRATEGSGLGLSIAESFAHVCGGRLTLDIDGDLFKVTVCFPVYTA
jgi:signal transduction histidine kinase